MSDRRHAGTTEDDDHGPLNELDFDSDEEESISDDDGEPRPGADSTPSRRTLNIDTGVGFPPDREARSRRSSDAARKVVAWRDLPKKRQLVVITLARLSEPLVQTSLQSYMFYQLQWFDPSLPDAVISSQAGILHASFTAAQFFTAMMWGRVADSAWAGRKTVIMIGLLGTRMYLDPPLWIEGFC